MMYILLFIVGVFVGVKYAFWGINKDKSKKKICCSCGHPVIIGIYPGFYLPASGQYWHISCYRGLKDGDEIFPNPPNTLNK